MKTPLHWLFGGLIALAVLGGACHNRTKLAETPAYDPGQAGERMRRDIAALAADSMGGRPPGTAYEKRAAGYIIRQWETMGIKPQLQTFQVRVGEHPLSCQNIIAFKDFGADSTILIGAHYDHLGQGGEKSLEIRHQGLHPGADDNASGVALMLELARWLAPQQARKYNYAWVAFTAHEMGLFGSKEIVKSDRMKEWKIAWMLNFDMVGRLSEAHILRLSYCPQFRQIAPMKADPGELYIRLDQNFETQNDYTTFCEAGIPAISLTTGIHDDYHRMSDTPEKINIAGMEKILAYAKRQLGN